jgi:hypothetical protein
MVRRRCVHDERVARSVFPETMIPRQRVQGGAAKRRAKGKDGLKNPLGKEKKEKTRSQRGGQNH